MLTKDILFGMNIVSLAGFLIMGLTLTLNRQKRFGAAPAFALMAVGTALLLAGLYLGGTLTR